MSIDGVLKFSLACVAGAGLLSYGTAYCVAEEGAHASAKALQSAFADVADKAFPSVVIVKVKKGVPQGYSQGRRVLPPWLQSPERDEERETAALGSGFLIRDDGYIITNHHVAGDAIEMSVVMHDGRELPAKRIGTDWKTDISVLKIDTNAKLPFLKFADSDKVKVGHWAIAIGAPYSLGYTMTTGIVSQKGRSVGLNLYEDYIQTDAAINPGNSGGPLLNIDGEVIGVNDFIVGSGSQGEVVGTTGLAFAIPSNLVSQVANSIIKNGEVVRPWIGISMQDLDQELKKQFAVDSGVLVRGVVSGDPADKGGLKPGDVIVKLGSAPVASTRELQFGLLRFSPGDKIPMSVMRDGKPLALEIVAGKQRSDAVAGDNDKDSSARLSHQGSALASFGLKLAEKSSHLVIEAVASGSPASYAGLQPGMLVYAINRRKVDSVQEAEKAALASSKRLLLYVDDGQTKLFIALSR